jgi:hypothetical protein
VTHSFRGIAAGFAGPALVAMAALFLAACSGAVTDPAGNPAPTPTPVVVLPQTATLYSGLPTTFTISGGTAPYTLISSDQAVVNLTSPTSSTGFTVVPNEVAADTAVVLTIRDALATQATVTATVKPRSISNLVTVTPSASQPAACGTALCAGGDAEVAAKLTQNGVPIQGRNVRFDVVSGDLRIITSGTGTPEVLATTGTTVTDSTGTARIRVRSLSDAGAQTALLQATDTSSGASQRVAVTIAPSSSSPLNAQPSTLSFIGRDGTSCASNISAEVIVFGGRPPYSISQPGTFLISPVSLATSGSRFTVTAIGQCTPGAQIAVVDTNGSVVTVTATNTVKPGVVISNPPPLVVAPESVVLDTCDSTASVTLSGGTGTYYGAAGSSTVDVAISGNTATIFRRRTTGTASSPISVGISDGQTAKTVTVNLQGAALTCP